MLYRWFLDVVLIERSSDAMVFTKNRQRLLDHDVGRALFDEVVWLAEREGLLSDEHFSMDGILSEAAASLAAHRRRKAPSGGGLGAKGWLCGWAVLASTGVAGSRVWQNARCGARRPTMTSSLGWP